MTEAQLLNLDITGFEDRQMTEEEIRELLNDEEYKAILESSANEDEKLKEECEESKASIKLANVPDKKKKNEHEIAKMGLVERLACGDYSAEQIKEAELGMENGLPVEMLLLYFIPSYPAEHMQEMRKLAEKLVE